MKAQHGNIAWVFRTNSIACFFEYGCCFPLDCIADKSTQLNPVVTTDSLLNKSAKLHTILETFECAASVGCCSLIAFHTRASLTHLAFTVSLIATPSYHLCEQQL